MVSCMMMRLSCCKTAEGRDSDWMLVKIIEDFLSHRYLPFTEPGPELVEGPTHGTCLPYRPQTSSQG